MLTRRELIQQTGHAAAAVALSNYAAIGRAAPPPGITVNDLHSRLNATRVDRVVAPQSVEEIQAAVRRSAREGQCISIAGGRHAMGGQQFGTGALLLDMRPFNRILGLNVEAGLVEVESGVEWPALISELLRAQAGQHPQWGIRQKQTGADRMSLGGGLAANIHGRGLRSQPLIADIESFDLIDASGEVRTCSRRENAELFSLVIGGYGLFGIVTRIRLRLMPRRKLERTVELIDVDDLTAAFDRRIHEGYLYGDFQYATDPESQEFLRRGVFSCYRPVDDETPIPAKQRTLSEADWKRLILLAHTDRKRAFDEYAAHYLGTSKQIYWSDTHQLSQYVDDYHRELDRQLGATHPGSEMITEIYVPRDELAAFLNGVRRDFREHRVELIYGTIRLIERDDESFLAWAKQPYACVIFNLHVVHTAKGRDRAACDFRRLIDRAIRYGGSYYLTYHRWANRRQVERCYPQFFDFLRLKRKYDPQERFQSDWYRHYTGMFE